MKKGMEKFVKYGVYGVATTVFNLTLFMILKELGMHYILANIVSYLFAVLLNYILNKKYVYQTKATEYQKYEFMRFLLVRILFLGLENILFYLIIEKFHFDIYVGKIALSVIIMILTFFANNVFVFKE